MSPVEVCWMMLRSGSYETSYRARCGSGKLGLFEKEISNKWYVYSTARQSERLRVAEPQLSITL